MPPGRRHVRAHDTASIFRLGISNFSSSTAIGHHIGHALSPSIYRRFVIAGLGRLSRRWSRQCRRHGRKFRASQEAPRGSRESFTSALLLFLSVLASAPHYCAAIAAIAFEPAVAAGGYLMKPQVILGSLEISLLFKTISSLTYAINRRASSSFAY